MTVTIKQVNSKSELNQFIKLPWKVYKNDINWVAPLISHMKSAFNPNKNPYFKHSEVQFFLALKNNVVIGRIAAHINRNHNKFHKDKVGFFGFFECIPDYDAAQALFDEARNWLKNRGMEIIRGPMSFSTNDECGLLVKGFNMPPMVMMTYNPQYYESFIEKYGFKKAKDLYAYYINLKKMPERFDRIMKRVNKRKKFILRKINPKKMEEEISTIFYIYNQAWQNNWGFVPMEEDEFRHLTKKLKLIIDYDFVFIAEIDGKPVGFSLSLPDINQELIKIKGRLFPFGWLKLLLASKKIDRVRAITLGVVKEYKNLGIDLAFYYETIKNAIKKGCARGEMSWVLEDNIRMRRPLEKIGAEIYKTYRIYDMKLN
ncbi:MAG: N-acetyltransferase [Candidatus Cloacimonetes bacterium]|nr:N-acetyltransferase [Candidatus Cloacimonadota bacterium]